MGDTPKYLLVKQFRERGYLHEVNRLVLHPLGLALEVKVAVEQTCRVDIPVKVIDALQRSLDASIEWGHGGLTKEEAETLKEAIASGEWLNGGDETLGRVWDQREDPEGVYYGEDLLDPEKAARVASEVFERRGERIKQLGYVVQPVPGVRALTTNYVSPDDAPTRTEHFEGIGPVEFEQ